MADAELVHGDTIPTGTYLDMTANLPVVDPTRIEAPTLILRGEYDGIATEADLVDFFTKLKSHEKQLVVLPDTALPDALRVAEHLRISVSNNPLSIDGRLISATLSLGVAELSFGEGPEQLFERVDTALYASKAAGRNRVTTAPPLPLAAPGLAAPERQP